MARENVTVMVELPIIRQWFATNKAMVLSLDSFTVSLYIYIYIFFQIRYPGGGDSSLWGVPIYSPVCLSEREKKFYQKAKAEHFHSLVSDHLTQYLRNTIDSAQSALIRNYLFPISHGTAL